MRGMVHRPIAAHDGEHGRASFDGFACEASFVATARRFHAPHRQIRT
jgi:hypothetical protein